MHQSASNLKRWVGSVKLENIHRAESKPLHWIWVSFYSYGPRKNLRPQWALFQVQWEVSVEHPEVCIYSVNQHVLELVKSISSHGSSGCNSLLFDSVRTGTGSQISAQYQLVMVKVIFQICFQFEGEDDQKDTGTFGCKALVMQKNIWENPFCSEFKTLILRCIYIWH